MQCPICWLGGKFTALKAKVLEMIENFKESIRSIKRGF
jgi:hypothetical protein